MTSVPNTLRLWWVQTVVVESVSRRSILVVTTMGSSNVVAST